MGIITAGTENKGNREQDTKENTNEFDGKSKTHIVAFEKAESFPDETSEEIQENELKDDKKEDDDYWHQRIKTLDKEARISLGMESNADCEKYGVLRMVPTKDEDGWILNDGGMFTVSYKDNIEQITDSQMREGWPVMFTSIDGKNACNLRVVERLNDALWIDQCLTRDYKTRHDAKYFVRKTKLELDGDFSTNSFKMLKDLSPHKVAKISEKVLNAFMNTRGGTMYIGVDSTSLIVHGVDAEKVNLNEIKEAVFGMIDQFEPKLDDRDWKQIKFGAVAVVTKEGELRKDLIVIRMVVPGPLEDQNGDKITFATKNGGKYKKNLKEICSVVV